MVQQFTRQTAYKIWIADIFSGEFVKGVGEFDPNYFVVRDRKVSRVNVIGFVIGQEGDTLSVDDGTGNISLRVWGDDVSLFEGLNPGDVVLVIGRVKVFNDARYIVPEAVKKLNSSWLKLRRLELNRKFGDPIKIEKLDVNEVAPPSEVVTEEVVDVNEERGKVLLTIEEKDGGEGVSVEEVVSICGENSEKVIQELLKDGEIFEVKMGKLRILP